MSPAKKRLAAARTEIENARKHGRQDGFLRWSCLDGDARSNYVDLLDAHPRWIPEPTHDDLVEREVTQSLAAHVAYVAGYQSAFLAQCEKHAARPASKKGSTP